MAGQPPVLGRTRGSIVNAFAVADFHDHNDRQTVLDIVNHAEVADANRVEAGVAFQLFAS